VLFGLRACDTSTVQCLLFIVGRYSDGMTRDEAEAALQAWATVQRDDLVRAAYEAGVPKHRISVLTRISRTTIDKILETPVSTTSDQLAEYLAKFTQSWPRRPELRRVSYRFEQPSTVASRHTVEEVTGWLLADAEFKALKLGNWLGTPDGRFFAAAAATLTPAPYGDDLKLLLEALQLAAKQQHEEAISKLVLGTLGAAAVALLIGAANGMFD
jgi:hypothetical protein